jgi:iron complex outermembrane receptor protein
MIWRNCRQSGTGFPGSNTMHRFRLPKSHSGLVFGALLGAVMLPTTGVLAATESGGTLEEIIVTAQKREQSLQSVGTSITAFDAASLRESTLRDVTDIVSQTPGMQFNQTSPSVTVYNLRGVSQNDFGDHQEAPVAVYVDEAYVASMSALSGDMFDLERVEILRGPQGTLFGRNATGGLIHYVSKKPVSRNEGYLSVDYGSFQALNTQGAINASFSDTVQGRFSFGTANRDGYIKNSMGPDIGNQKQYAVRAQLRIEPSEQGEILLKIHGVKNDHEISSLFSWAASTPNQYGLGYFIGPDDMSNGACGGCDIAGYKNLSGDVYKQNENHIGLFDRDVYGATGKVSWQFDNFQFTSVTDFLHLKKHYMEDSDVGPVEIFNYNVFQTYDQFSQELRLNGDTGSMRWITGLYYLNYKSDDQALTDFRGLLENIVGVTDGVVGGAIYTLKTSSWSGFGQIEQDFGTGWTAIAGLRYTNDRKQYHLDEMDPFEGPPSAIVFDDTHNWPIWTAKLELDKKITSDVMAYASVSRGAKGGGYSAPSTGDLSTLTRPELVQLLRFDQEKLTSYEVGVKSELWNRKARLNAAAFYYDYRGYQGFVLRGLTQVVANSNARVKGAEIEFAVVPTTGLNIGLGVSYLDTIAKAVAMPDGVSFLDREMPQAPEVSVNASIRYNWAMGNGDMSFGIDGKWNDDYYLELVNSPVDLQPAYAVANAKLTYAGAGNRWDVSAFVRNLGDTRYRVYNLDLSVIGVNQGVYALPRTYGVGFNYRWGN